MGFAGRVIERTLLDPPTLGYEPRRFTLGSRPVRAARRLKEHRADPNRRWAVRQRDRGVSRKVRPRRTPTDRRAGRTRAIRPARLDMRQSGKSGSAGHPPNAQHDERDRCGRVRPKAERDAFAMTPGAIAKICGTCAGGWGSAGHPCRQPHSVGAQPVVHVAEAVGVGVFGRVGVGRDEIAECVAASGDSFACSRQGRRDQSLEIKFDCFNERSGSSGLTIQIRREE
jgi:hypothetical protein